jgi:predicted RNA-binding protein YlxR (DUF448 family)
VAHPSELVRLVRSPDGEVRVDRHASGRGAWLCAGSLEECARVAKRRKAFGRAFRAPVDGAALDELLILFGSSSSDMADLFAAESASDDSNHQKG